jgi:hypothetical protein
METPPPAYRRLQQQLASLDWLCQGSVQIRRQIGQQPLRQPIYQWTRKVKGKTVTVNLTVEQYGRMRTAIAHQRLLTRTVRQMQKLSLKWIFSDKE